MVMMPDDEYSERHVVIQGKSYSLTQPQASYSTALTVSKLSYVLN